MGDLIEKKSENRQRNIGINFRVTAEELKLIESRMAQTGITNRRAYLLKMATDGQVIHLDVGGVNEMVRLLSNATNNINQIAKRVNETRNFYAHDLYDLRRQYDDIWGHIEKMLGKLAML